MMKKEIIKNILGVIGLFFAPQNISAQDLVFGQYMGSAIYTNPSLTGAAIDKEGNNGARLASLYRNQWATSTSVSNFSSNYFSYDQKVSDGFGSLGMYVISDRAGSAGAFATTQMNLTYAYQTPFGRNGWVGRYGLSVGYRSQGIDISKLRFEDQIDYRVGVVGNTNEVLSSNRVAKPDVNAGFMIHNQSFYVGGAIHNITRPNFDYVGTVDNYCERRMSLQTGGNIILKNGSYGSEMLLLPQLTYIKQKDFSQLNIAMGMKYDALYIGGGFRKSMMNYKNADAMIVSIGIIKDHVRFSYSYEKVLSSIRFYAPMTHEFGVQYALTSKNHRNLNTYAFPKI
jgi:type IX secretion system PorP/SprF family membrane protein